MSNFLRYLMLIALFAAWPQATLADNETLRDPTRPLNHTVTSRSPQALTLHSILISSERKLAIINGQRLRENDVVEGSGGVRIKRIGANDVVLQQGSKTWTLSLNTTSVRK